MRRRFYWRKGATAVEYAIVGPAILMLVAGMVVVGLGVFRYDKSRPWPARARVGHRCMAGCTPKRPGINPPRLRRLQQRDPAHGRGPEHERSKLHGYVEYQQLPLFHHNCQWTSGGSDQHGAGTVSYSGSRKRTSPGRLPLPVLR